MRYILHIYCLTEFSLFWKLSIISILMTLRLREVKIFCITIQTKIQTIFIGFQRHAIFFLQSTAMSGQDWL